MIYHRLASDWVETESKLRDMSQLMRPCLQSMRNWSRKIHLLTSQSARGLFAVKTRESRKRLIYLIKSDKIIHWIEIDFYQCILNVIIDVPFDFMQFHSCLLRTFSALIASIGHGQQQRCNRYDRAKRLHSYRFFTKALQCEEEPIAIRGEFDEVLSHLGRKVSFIKVIWVFMGII